MLKMFLITGAGGFFGSGLRYLAQRLVPIVFPASFPLGTLMINVVGSLMIGIIYAVGEKSSILSPEMRIFLAVGICGGFTTFSTFSLDSFSLLRSGEYLYFSIYVIATLILSLIATIAGIWLIKSL